MSRGFWSGVLGNHSAPACRVTVLSCSMAAGRYTSAETVRTFFLRFSIRCLASLAVVVVLPVPCRPAIRITAGGCAARSRSATPSPMVRLSSSWTTPTSAWPGLSEPTTSVPSAFSLTRAMKSRTTGSATSASSSAMRTSRSMSCTLASVMRACPRMVLTRRDRRSDRVEAIGAGSLALALAAVLAYVAAALPSAAPARWPAPALVVGWILHGTLLALDVGGWGRVGAGARLGFGTVLSLTAWLVLAVHAVESRFVPLPGVRRTLATAGAVSVMLAWVFPGEVHKAASALEPVHWALGVASYA